MVIEFVYEQWIILDARRGAIPALQKLTFQLGHVHNIPTLFIYAGPSEMPFITLFPLLCPTFFKVHLHIF